MEILPAKLTARRLAQRRHPVFFSALRHRRHEHSVKAAKRCRCCRCCCRVRGAPRLTYSANTAAGRLPAPRGRWQRWWSPEAPGSGGEASKGWRMETPPWYKPGWQSDGHLPRVDWLKGNPAATQAEEEAAAFSSDGERWSGTAAGAEAPEAAAAAALHTASMLLLLRLLLRGGEGQRKFQTGASSPRIIIEGGGMEPRGDSKQRRGTVSRLRRRVFI